MCWKGIHLPIFYRKTCEKNLAIFKKTVKNFSLKNITGSGLYLLKTVKTKKIIFKNKGCIYC